MENYLSFHHIGIACRDIEATKPFYIAQGYVASETVFDPVQSVNICFLDKAGMPRIELLSPIGEDSPVVRTLETPAFCVAEKACPSLRHRRKGRVLPLQQERRPCRTR